MKSILAISFLCILLVIVKYTIPHSVKSHQEKPLTTSLSQTNEPTKTQTIIANKVNTPTKNYSVNTTLKGQIFSTDHAKTIKFTDLINQLASADYILLGETHDNPTHHVLQQKILDALIRKGNRPAVVFEMFDREDSGAITTSYRQFPHDADHIATAVAWNKSGWPDWGLYRPIIQTAMDANLPITAGNLSRKDAKEIVLYQLGILQLLNQRIASQMGLLKPLGEKSKHTLKEKMHKSHGKHIPSELIPNMIIAQRVRDATLVEAMISGNRGEGSILIAGKEHARTDYGVPFYLRHREPAAKIISLEFSDTQKSTDRRNSNKTDRLKLDEISHKRDSLTSYDYIWKLPEVSSSNKVAHQ